MKRLAIVEDNADNRLLLRVMLRGSYTLDEYEDGPSALAGMAAGLPDLVVMDISLPGMDGVEVLRRMRAEDGALKSVPAIALTAHAMRGDREKMLAAGFAEYMTKPIVDQPLLLETIARLAGG